MTDTLVNEAPMLTADLAFDLGDTLECDLRECDNEPVWLCDMTCGCDKDIPGCEPCRELVLWWCDAVRAECDTCGRRATFTNWRKI